MHELQIKGHLSPPGYFYKLYFSQLTKISVLTVNKDLHVFLGPGLLKFFRGQSSPFMQGNRAMNSSGGAGPFGPAPLVIRLLLLA